MALSTGDGPIFNHLLNLNIFRWKTPDGTAKAGPESAAAHPFSPQTPANAFAKDMRFAPELAANAVLFWRCRAIAPETGIFQEERAADCAAAPKGLPPYAFAARRLGRGGAGFLKTVEPLH